MSFRTLSIVFLALALAQGGGCAAGPTAQSGAPAVEWVRLKNGVRVTDTRWRLPSQVSLEVVELAPAQDPAWLPAAKAGVDSVFPPVTSGAPLQLVVRWPSEAALAAEPDPAGILGPLDPRDWFRASDDDPSIQVALVDTASNNLIQAAELKLTHGWLDASAPAPSDIERAFRTLAASLVSG